jgi:hypothetical protein
MKLTDKQKEILLALVEGKEVEYYDEAGNVWESVNTISVLTYFGEKYLRIKPEIPKDIVVKEYKKYIPCLDDAYDEPNVEYVFDGVTHVLKSVKMLGEGTKEQPTGDGWISNEGNDTERWPDGYGVTRDTKIETKHRNGDTGIDYAYKWTVTWTETDKDEYDIVKFRILKD